MLKSQGWLPAQSNPQLRCCPPPRGREGLSGTKKTPTARPGERCSASHTLQVQPHSPSRPRAALLFKLYILLGRLGWRQLSATSSSIMRRLSPRGCGWPLFALNSVHSSGIEIGNALIEVKTTSAFPVGHGHHLYEISVEPINSIHHLCSDGSTPSWLWSTGEERSSLYRTFLRGCKKNASLLGAPGPRPRPSSLRATVCHPFFSHLRTRFIIRS